MAILSKIKEICNSAVPEYGFEFEHSKMMNVKADNASFPLIFFEEYTDGKITQQMGLKKAVMVELSFMRLCPMHNQLKPFISRGFACPLKVSVKNV